MSKINENRIDILEDNLLNSNQLLHEAIVRIELLKTALTTLSFKVEYEHASKEYEELTRFGKEEYINEYQKLREKLW